MRVHVARATAPVQRDAALDYLRKRQDPQDGGNNANNGGNAGNAGGNNNAGNNAGNAGGNNNQNAGNNNNQQQGGNNNNQQQGGNNNANQQQGGNNNGTVGGVQNGNGTTGGNATVSGGAGGNNTNSSATVSIPQTAAAGLISMISPAQTGTESYYYKIAPSETITFKWNFTDLYVQPKNLTVVASCGANGNTYPVGPTDGMQNVFDGNTTEIHWVPYDWEQVPGQPRFAAASYQLQIWDERGPGVGRKGGWLTPYSGLKFGMYIPQQYVPLAEWTCATCSSAQRLLGEPAGLSIMTSLIVMFVSAYALLRRA